MGKKLFSALLEVRASVSCGLNSAIKGNCSVTIDGPAKTPANVLSQEGAATHYSYNPVSPGEYFVNVQSGGKHISGSPFNVKVSGKRHF